MGPFVQDNSRAECVDMEYCVAPINGMVTGQLVEGCLFGCRHCNLIGQELPMKAPIDEMLNHFCRVPS